MQGQGSHSGGSGSPLPEHCTVQGKQHTSQLGAKTLQQGTATLSCSRSPVRWVQSSSAIV